jgi:hypothetical protein
MTVLLMRFDIHFIRAHVFQDAESCLLHVMDQKNTCMHVCCIGFVLLLTLCAAARQHQHWLDVRSVSLHSTITGEVLQAAHHAVTGSHIMRMILC